MPLKQETAAEDSAATIERITKLFLAMGLPYLAEGKLYLGTPYSILESFQRALDAQHTDNEKNKFKNRLKYAGIARERTADTFKWDEDTYPFVEPGIIENALTVDFIRQRKNLVVAGPPGVGKSLLVVIIACKAIREYFSVKYKTAHRIATDLQEARDGNSLAGYIKKLQSCDVFVVEDITFTNFDLNTAHSFFSIIDGRYVLSDTLQEAQTTK